MSTAFRDDRKAAYLNADGIERATAEESGFDKSPESSPAVA